MSSEVDPNFNKEDDAAVAALAAMDEGAGSGTDLAPLLGYDYDDDEPTIDDDFAPTPRADPDSGTPFLCLKYGANGQAEITNRTNDLCDEIKTANDTISKIEKGLGKKSLKSITPLIYPQIYNSATDDDKIKTAVEASGQAEAIANYKIQHLTLEKNIIKYATELNILQLLLVDAQPELYLYQILEANINSIINAANDHLQDRNGEGLRSYTRALDMGIDTFSYIAETCATILEKLSNHPTVISWKQKVDTVLKRNPRAVLCGNKDGPIHLASINSASGQKVLYDGSNIHEILHKCTKFSVNRVLFNANPAAAHPPGPKKAVKLSVEDNEIRLGRFALQSGNAAFKISLSGGNFVAIKAAKYWVETTLGAADDAAAAALNRAIEATVASELVAARGLIQLSSSRAWNFLTAGKTWQTAGNVLRDAEAAKILLDLPVKVDEPIGKNIFKSNAPNGLVQLLAAIKDNPWAFEPEDDRDERIEGTSITAEVSQPAAQRPKTQRGGRARPADVFQMANKISDLDLKFVCIDKTIADEAHKLHIDGDPGFGLCRTKVNNGEFIDLSIPIFSRNPILALIIHNSASDMTKTIAELAYIVSMNPLEPKAQTRMIRLDFLKDIDPASKAAAIGLLTKAYADPVIQTAIEIINSDVEPAQLLQQLQGAGAAPPGPAPPAPPGAAEGGKKRTKKNKKKKTNKKKRTNKKNKRSKRKNKRSNKRSKRKKKRSNK